MCSLRIILGDEVRAYPIPNTGQFVLGRGADIVIPHVNISRRHLAVRVEPSVEVSDLGSTNLTTLYGVPLEPNAWMPIRAGDVLVLGGEALVMLHDGDVRSVPTRHMGRDILESELARHIAEYERSATPFAICTVSSQSPKKWIDILAGVLLERDELIVLSDTEATLLLANRNEEQAAGVLKALDGHLGRISANARLRLRSCPADGATIDALSEHPSADTRGQRTTMRPAGPLVRNAAMLKLYGLVEEVAPSHVNVLILGETGVGKDVLAHAFHDRSPRARAPFVSLNCSALPEALLESELFGYERGAFTGAVTAKPGLLESAEGGTIFLDELGEMPLATQAKFLRVLEERTVRRVGGLKEKAIDVRVLAATNRDLPSDIAQGRFRADLYYRLNGLSVVVPPLRERVDEIYPFAAHFMTHAAGILNKPPPKLTQAARSCLEAYSWPGNIRELRNVVERAVLLARDRPITPDLLPPEVAGSVGGAALLARHPTPQPRASMATWTTEGPTGAVSAEAFIIPPAGDIPRVGDASRLLEEVEQLEKARIVEALTKCNGNQTRAAQLLGITRRVLINRIERYNLPRPRGPQVG
ncbi:MAG TPA: sigma 54-interacting transcriptional regulator [Labilithrix sp.]|nr:sigma 54-interacting transcriptional regulator [Labilithrix sp.]